MQMNVHLNFPGNCAEAFAFYRDVFGSKDAFSMTYGEAPAGVPIPPNWNDKILHTSISIGGAVLMGCDAPPGRSKPIEGVQISMQSSDEAEARRIYEALKEGGKVDMPMAPTFWSPLFGMCTDKFGVAWMVGMPGSAQA